MSQDNLVKLECTGCKRVANFTKRNKKKIKEKLVLQKFCKHCKKHSEHKEVK